MATWWKVGMYHVGHIYMKKTDEGVLFDDFAEDFFFGAETSFWIELAEGMELIYGHYDDNRGDAEFIHIKNGICLREYRMYDFEVDTDEGDIPEFESWVDVSSYVDENLLTRGRQIYNGRDNFFKEWCEFFNKLKGVELNYGEEISQSDTTETQRKTKEYILEYQKQLLDVILTNLLENFTEIRQIYGDDDVDSPYYLPNITNTETLKYLIQLYGIYILNVEKDNICYVEFAFYCEWDEEHGYGVMMHKDRVIDTGEADTAFLNWIAQKDVDSTK